MTTTTPKRHIIAIGGFSREADHASLDLYVLAQARKRPPSICFLGTASGDAESYIAKFYAAFGRQSCRPMHVPLFGRTPDLTG
jgi:peptidase E